LGYDGDNPSASLMNGLAFDDHYSAAELFLRIKRIKTDAWKWDWLYRGTILRSTPYTRIASSEPRNLWQTVIITAGRQGHVSLCPDRLARTNPDPFRKPRPRRSGMNNKPFEYRVIDNKGSCRSFMLSKNRIESTLPTRRQRPFVSKAWF